MLTGPEIRRQREQGRIVIEPFSSDRINPNSYDVCLQKTIGMYEKRYLDAAKPNPCEFINIQKSGYTLYPNKIYLGATIESTVSMFYVPIIYGKSSLARLGLSIHATAGFGDLGWGFVGGKCTYPTWTLELSVLQPLKIYAEMRIGQVMFEKADGEALHYTGKYNHQKGPQPFIL